MGVDCLVLGSRHKKLRQSKKVDRITNLPDSLITHILSFLPIEDVVRTCVLSTKWKGVWTTVTTLRFDDDAFGITYFANFVERVLLLGCPVIQNFHLSCSEEYKAFRICSWISSVISRNVQKLAIIHTSGQKIVLPCSLFYNNAFLMDLNIRMTLTLCVPTSICFSTLKILKLEEVRFSNVYASRSNELHMTFLVLEELSLSNCEWKKVKVVNVDAPRLNNFSLFNFETISKADCVIRIHGSSLQKINWSGCASEEYMLTSPSSVKYATILHYVLDTDEYCLFACTLFRQFSSLKFLTLSWENIEALAFIEDVHESLAISSNLIKLTITERFTIYDLLVGELFAFLRCLPSLDFLDINLESQRLHSDKMLLEVVPPCFQTHLKVVKCQISRSTKGWLGFVKLLLKNAFVLEKMSIYAPESYIEKIKEKVLEFPKGSDHASISFNE